VIVGLDHVQLAMPPGGEDEAREFYGRLLNLPEIEKPEPLKARGGCWFAGDGVQIHLGVQQDFVPAKKAHPAFLVADLDALCQKLAAAGFSVKLDYMVPDRQRGHVHDPFGNRLEFIQDSDGFQQRMEEGTDMSGDFRTELREYLDGLVGERPSELQKMEAYAQEHNFPIVGPASGQYCYQVARMIGAQRVFELGSGYGYSTAWFARAVQKNGGGEVYHVVWEEKLTRMARQHLSALGFDDLVQYRTGEAVGILRQTAGPFDLIFNDIDKEGYPDSLPVIEEKLRPGGVLIIDNMIWNGRVWDDNNHDEATEGIREFTRRITTSPNWITSLVPIRDGLIVAYKV